MARLRTMRASMKKKYHLPLVGDILRKVAHKAGASVLLEPNWRVVGQISFKSGRKRYFRTSTLDLNPMGASAIASDKDYANFFMAKMGYPVIPGKAFYSDTWAKTVRSKRDIDAAWNYALSLRLPVIVKPNSGSRGKNVALVHTKRDFYRTMRAIFRHDHVALVQRPVIGNDYRIVVLDKQIISAYQRLPLNVVGDGRSTIAGLLQKKQRAFVRSGRDTVIDINDARIAAKLLRSGMSMRSKPVKNEVVYLLNNANLSSGGDSIDVTKAMHPAFKKISVALTHDMGLRLCGVDLMIEGDISEKPGKYWVLEINSAPGLDHYAQSGKDQNKIVEEMYLQVLKSMDN
ncbi:MAG: D-alanine--D-alanine ligase [Candidatus Kaiserbacteria bacterium]|nr:D-alanine--D-alanine ligase [Candidatus Kaiserbacteria bacterium]